LVGSSMRIWYAFRVRIQIPGGYCGGRGGGILREDRGKIQKLTRKYGINIVFRSVPESMTSYKLLY
jgi:hypothetical protein